MNKHGYTKIEILVVIVLLGIVAFITVNKASYAFVMDNAEAKSEVKNMIELQAQEYALANLDIFKETNTTFITVNDLVTKGFLLGNNEGLITDPSDNKIVYNENKIKLELNENKKDVKATLVD